MEINFEVNMKTNIMYDFMLYHAYRRSNGYLGPIFGTITLVFGIRAAAQGNSQFLIWLLFSVLFLFMTPVSLYTKAKTQCLSERFQKPIKYQINDEGITIFQDDQSAEAKWEDMKRAVCTRKSIFVYSGKSTAFIFPREDLGMELENVMRIIAEKMDPKKVNIR